MIKNTMAKCSNHSNAEAGSEVRKTNIIAPHFGQVTNYKIYRLTQKRMHKNYPVFECVFQLHSPSLAIASSGLSLPPSRHWTSSTTTNNRIYTKTLNAQPPTHTNPQIPLNPLSSPRYPLAKAYFVPLHNPNTVLSLQSPVNKKLVFHSLLRRASLRVFPTIMIMGRPLGGHVLLMPPPFLSSLVILKPNL